MGDGLLDEGAVVFGDFRGMRDALVHRERLARVDAPGERGGDLAAGDFDAVVVGGARVGGDALPPRDRAIEGLALRRVGSTAQVLEGGLVGVHVAHARAALDRHVADRHALFHGHRVEDVAGVLVGVADAALRAEQADDLEDDVLGVDARGELAVHLDASHLGAREGEALGGEHVAHLARADPEGDGAEGAVGRGVAVAAGDGHPRLGQAELGPDHMHDALLPRVRTEIAHPGLRGIALELHHHRFGHGVGEGSRL